MFNHLLKHTLIAILLSEIAPSYSLAQISGPEVTAVNSAYLLGVGDRIRIDVFNAPDYSGEYQVLNGGVVNLPFLGDVQVSGITLRQASEAIAAELAYFIRRPRVTLSLLDSRPLQVAIVGEINRPGSYRLNQTGQEEFPSLTQIIELAGGITQSADLRNIQIQRKVSRFAPGTAVNTSSSVLAKNQTLDVDLWQLLRESRLEEDMLLQDGDRIIVPTANSLTAEELTELASASFSPDQISVNVVGEVESPGTIRVPPNTPMNQAILTAGGFTNTARTGRVTLVRLNPNGSVTQRKIDIDFAAGVNSDSNPALQSNDTVIIGRSTLTQARDAIGSVLSPLSGMLNILRVFEGFTD